MKTNETIIGVLGGVAIGTALGILFAPDKGTNTRKKIAQKSNDVKNKAFESFNGVLDTVSEKCNSLINKGEDMAVNGINTVNRELDTAKNNIK
ncbi:YtxH domain-containing protein [Flavobacterium sp. ARAG 55.4]|uniref:YtxH domain-containing protein n=1 Tax=Flavobacterium plantiphilum TaxID=3163297 RepID=A0ABW8XUR3_9FLAO